jgi:hypothetical protein
MFTPVVVGGAGLLGVVLLVIGQLLGQQFESEACVLAERAQVRVVRDHSLVIGEQSQQQGMQARWRDFLAHACRDASCRAGSAQAP